MAHGLKVDNLVVNRSGRRVLHGVSLEIIPQTVTCLLGANGAGKSSLVMAIAGMLKAESGDIRLDGESIRSHPPFRIRRAGVSVIPEGHKILSELSVYDNLLAAGSHLSKHELQLEIEKVILLFPELKPKWSVSGKHLSGGQKQMVSLSQGLVARPRYILVDELSLGLAPAIVSRLGKALNDIACSGITVLLIEQFTSMALEIASHAHIMDRGRISFSGTSEELRNRPEVLHDAYFAT